MTETLCPALSELHDGLSPEVAAHAAECLRCRALIGALGIEVEASATAHVAERPSLRLLRHPDDEFNVACGDVCAALAPGNEQRLLCIVITIDKGAIEVVPVSDEIKMATDRDLILDHDILGFRALAETWNAGTVLVEELAEVIASLDKARWEQLLGLVEAAENGTEPPADLPVGPPIIGDDDPRWNFHILEGERVKPYFEGASAFRAFHDIVELFRHQVDEKGLSLDELARRHAPRVQDHETWVLDFAQGDLNLLEIPSEALGDLFDDVQLPALWQIASLVDNSLQPGPAPAVEGRLIRAFRVGIRSVAKSEPTHDYAAQVIRRMAERQLASQREQETA